jgi:hypothetical protein
VHVSVDEIVVIVASGVIAATLVVMGMTLIRYRAIVTEGNRSTQLAKNVWDAMNSRLSVQDARIIDLMAKVEVYSVRKAPITKPVITGDVSEPSHNITTVKNESPAGEVHAEEQGSGETESQILRALVTGPKSSSEIRSIIGKSREHTARLMKILYERGLVLRNDRNKPYVYEVTEAGARYLKGN